MKSKTYEGWLLLLLVAFVRGDTSVQIQQDNLIKVVQKYMGVTPINDYIVHYDEQIELCLDDYFRGQNPSYSIEVMHSAQNNELIYIQQFMDPIVSESFEDGKALAGYVGYCQEINRHILYIYTDQGYLQAYLVYIGLSENSSPRIIQRVLNLPLHVTCPQFRQMEVQCSTFYSQVNNFLLMGCKNQDSEPVLVRFSLDVPQRNIYVSSCIVFQIQHDNQNIYIKYVSPNNDFVVIEVEQVDDTISNVRDLYIAIDQIKSQQLRHSTLLDSVRLSELSPDFLGSTLAQPLNIQGFAKVDSFLLAFNEMGELYQIRLINLEGYLCALPPLTDSIRRIQKYKIKNVMQASIWDQTPNRILVEGTSTDDGSQSVIELTVSNTDLSAAIGNTVYANLNPMDTFFLNQRGASMENKNYLIQEIYEDGRKLLIRIFQKNLPFYSMPISDYFVTYRGYICALILDYYSNYIVIVEDSQFKILNLNGNTLKIGGSNLSQIYYNNTRNSTTETRTALSALTDDSYSVFLSEQPGFLSQTINNYNQTFYVKFIDPMSTQIYQVMDSLVSTFEVGRPSIVPLKEMFFIGPNITLQLNKDDNPNLPSQYIERVSAELKPLFYQTNHSIINPFAAEQSTQCKNFTLFVANYQSREYVCHLCFSQFAVYLFLARYDTYLHDFDIQLEFAMHPFEIIDLNYDADQKIILALTKLTTLEDKFFIHVINIVVSDRGNGLEWMGKSDQLPYPARHPTHSRPSTFYKSQDRILLVVTEQQRWILVYHIDLHQIPSIQFMARQMNPQTFKPSRTFGSIWKIHFLPFHFLLFAYTNDLVVARGNPFLQYNDTFTFVQQFKRNIYSKIQVKNGFVLLYKTYEIEQWDFSDPFIPEYVRSFSIPYPNYEFYFDGQGDIITTNDLPDSTVGIWKNLEVQDKYYMACFKTNTKMSHDSLYFIRELTLSEELKQQLKNKITLLMFGYTLFGGKNYVFLNIGKSVIPYLLYFHQAVQLNTPSDEIDSRIPLNLTISTDRSCKRLRHMDSPCAYSLKLFGEMSGTVIQSNSKVKNQVILSSPTQDPRVIMDPYFDGFNLRFSVSRILKDPDDLKIPLLKPPDFLNRLELPTYETSANITHQFYIKKQYMDKAVLATVDSLRSVAFQQLHYDSEKNKMQFTNLLSITIPDVDQVEQIREIDRPASSTKPAATFWAVYGKVSGFRRIVMYNVTALYHDNSSEIDFNTQALNNFRRTQSFYPWYVPIKWEYSKNLEYFVITYTYGNPYDEPIILFKMDFQNGMLIQLGIINAIVLKLNVFTSASFYLHSEFPILIAGGGGPFITIVNLQTQSYMYSVNLNELDPVFNSVDSINIQWLDQIDSQHFIAFIQGLGLAQFKLTINSPKDDYDDLSDPHITLIGITYQPGSIVYQNGLESPFSKQKNLLSCLFQETISSGDTIFSIKLINGYEPSRSRIFYQFVLPPSTHCYRPQFFNPFSLESQKHNPGKIFISILCNGYVYMYQLWEFSFLELDFSFIDQIDPTQFPLIQELEIRASNLNDEQGVTLNFEVSVLESGKQLTDADIGGLSVIILLLIVIFILLGWVIRKHGKKANPLNSLKSTIAESGESTLMTENIRAGSTVEELETSKYEMVEEEARAGRLQLGSDEF